MNTSRMLNLMAVVALGFVPALAKAAPEPQPQQFYGKWQEAKNYFYRSYFFKPTSDAKEYQEHKVIFYKEDPRFYYYYNPKSGHFWGRGLVGSAGSCHEQYQLLAPQDQKADLNDIPGKAFPTPAAPPKLADIPGGKPAPGVNPPPAGGANPPAGGPKPAPPGTGAPPAPGANGAIAKVPPGGAALELPKDEPPKVFTEGSN
jgi:hypothetical protein